MNSSFIKRLGAYLIDVVIISLIMSIVSMIFTTQNSYKISEQLLELNEQVINNTVELETYYGRISDIYISLDKENFLINIINCAIMVLYFVVLPLYKNGKTIGKKIFKIKIAREDKEDLTANELILRNIIINGLLNTLLSFCLVFLLSGFEYFTIVSILAFIQFVLVIISVIMMLVRKDKRGLHDIITKTHVIDEKLEVEYERV